MNKKADKPADSKPADNKQRTLDDHATRFSPLTGPQFRELQTNATGKCRIRRMQPEVAFVVRKRLRAVDLKTRDDVANLDAEAPTNRELLAFTVQRGLSQPNHGGLLFPGAKGAKYLASLTAPALVELFLEVAEFNELLG